jgi:hypothetical protein
MTCVVLRRRVFIFWSGCLLFGRGELGCGKRMRNKRRDNRQSGDILTFADEITDRLILLVIPSVILTVN